MFRVLINKFKDYRFKKRMARQRYKRGFADEDCWSLDSWLCTTFPMMILALRDMKNGAPDEEFPEYDNLPKDWKKAEYKKYKAKQEKLGYECDPHDIFTKWYIILTRIAYCLQQADKFLEVENIYADEYFGQLWGNYDESKSAKDWFTQHTEKVDEGYQLISNEVDEDLKNKYYKEEERIWQYKCKMKEEAMKLLDKYFYNLWD